MSPKISIIIPAFNAEQFIAEAINSVLVQKYNSEIEILIINDCSSDNTASVVSNIAKSHNQIKLLQNKRKKGPSGARNTGLIHATGEYIAFLDADDLWLKNHLKEGVGFLSKNNDVDVVFYNFDIFEYETRTKINDGFSIRKYPLSLKKKTLENGYYLIQDDIFSALLEEGFLHLQSMLIKRKAAEGILFNENVFRAEDRDYAMKLYRASKARFAFRNIITGVYYRQCNSLTAHSIQNSLSTGLDHMQLFTGYLTFELLDHSIKKKIKRLLLSECTTISYYYRKLNCYKLALRYVQCSFSYGFSIAQFSEFIKIIASCINYSLRFCFEGTKP